MSSTGDRFTQLLEKEVVHLTAIKDLCFGCMFNKGKAETCPQCGWVEGTMPDSPQHLPPGTILHNKYVIGNVLGQGGFGITYLGWDIHLDMKLAIKEYMPKDFATRSTGNPQVTFFTGDYQTHFDHGMKKFLEEARILAKYSNHPGIVPVRDFFEENGTAYLVMYYLDGIDLKRYLEQLGGRLPYDQAIHILMPVMDALKEIHKDGLLHRDISPDNIYVTTEGEIKLLDFGAARHAFNDNNRSLSVILKPGYAPEEQYRSKGRQGPWTDVYAVAATFYRMIVGQIPPESLDRLEVDTLIKPSNLGIALPEHVENALIKALSIKGADRFQTMEEFQSFLLNQQIQGTINLSHSHQPSQPTFHQQYVQNHSTQSYPNDQNRSPKKKKTGLIIGLSIAGVILTALVAFFIGAVLLFSDQKATIKKPVSKIDKPSIEEKIDPNEKPTDEVVMVKVPTLYNLTEEEAVAALQILGLKANIIPQENLITYAGKVFDQGIAPDTEIESNLTIDVFVNSGIPLPVDVNTIYTQQMSIINQYWDQAAILYNEQKNTEESLRVYTQAYLMATELYNHNSSLDAQFAQGYILSQMGFLKEKLGYLYYAVETSLDAVAILEEVVSKDSQTNPTAVGSAYANLSWFQILNFQPDLAVQSSLSALNYNPNDHLSKVNLAHAYLLSNSFEQATKTYLEIKDMEINGVLASEIMLSDFNKFISIGYPSDQIERARAVITGN